MTYRYFYDWEFEEDGTRILPISLGMISDDGRELYMINKDYWKWMAEGIANPSDWVKENVLDHISRDDRFAHGYYIQDFPHIIQNFISCGGKITDRNYVELWAYYASYDHVTLAQRFGPMIDLPEPIPMNTNDIKQLVGGKTIDFKPDNEHHALSDARWNKKVWELYK